MHFILKQAAAHAVASAGLGLRRRLVRRIAELLNAAREKPEDRDLAPVIGALMAAVFDLCELVAAVAFNLDHANTNTAQVSEMVRRLFNGDHFTGMPTAANHRVVIVSPAALILPVHLH